MPDTPDITYKSAKYCKHDRLNDYERRELDCWIAEHIEGLTVLHTANDIKIRDDVRLSDLAWKEFERKCPKDTIIGYWKGPRPVCKYSFSPSIALNVFQTNPKLADGWYFEHKDGYWTGDNDGLKVRPCRSFALCLMLALKNEWEYKDQESKDHSVGPGTGSEPSQLTTAKSKTGEQQ